jgi:metal-responsive CopG/Arc/MetJ family transcriptional regulator
VKAVQVVLDEELLSATDKEARRAKINRSELVRIALREYLRKKRIHEIRERDCAGYKRFPIRPGEFDAFDKIAAWPED